MRSWLVSSNRRAWLIIISVTILALLSESWVIVVIDKSPESNVDMLSCDMAVEHAVLHKMFNIVDTVVVFTIPMALIGLLNFGIIRSKQHWMLESSRKISHRNQLLSVSIEISQVAKMIRNDYKISSCNCRNHQISSIGKYI